VRTPPRRVCGPAVLTGVWRAADRARRSTPGATMLPCPCAARWPASTRVRPLPAGSARRLTAFSCACACRV
jgi:hypothetical protein